MEQPQISATTFDVDRIALALAERFLDRPVALLQEAAERPLAFINVSGFGEDEPEPYELDDDGIATVTIAGPLYQRAFSLWGFTLADGYDAIGARLRAAFEDRRSEAVMLAIDSPGGEVAGCFELASDLAALSATTGKPTGAYADQLMASAAYGLGSAADEITVPRIGQIGSIGVIIVGANRHEELKARGIRAIIAASPKGKLLSAAGSVLDPTSPEMGEFMARLQERVESISAVFASDVATRRRMTADAVMALNAATFTGERAVSVGLADHVGTMADAKNWLKMRRKPRGIVMSETKAPGTSALTAEQEQLIAMGSALQALTGQSGEGVLATISAWKEAHARVPALERRVKIEALQGRLATVYPPAQAFARDGANIPSAAAGPHPDFDGLSLAAFDARTSAALPHTATNTPPLAQKAPDAETLDAEALAFCKANKIDPEQYKAAGRRLFGGGA